MPSSRDRSAMPDRRSVVLAGAALVAATAVPNGGTGAAEAGLATAADPGFDEDLYITAEAEAFVKWHAGQLTWAQATGGGRIQLEGPPSLIRAFPTWNARSMFAHIRPVSRAATGPAG